MDDEKIRGKQDNDEAREREASELQAQIDEIISGKAEAEKPRNLRDLTRPAPTPSKGSESIDNEGCEGKNT